MSPPIEIAIPTTTVSNTAKPFTIYNISLRQPLRSYTVQKRFSDFTALHSAITSQCDNVHPPGVLPQKTWLKSSTSDPVLTEARRRGLEVYLRAINDASDARWRSCLAWRSFLNLPSSGASSNGTAPKAGLLADMSPLTMDPAVWLDIHRDVKATLREVRQHLSARQQMELAQKQYEESAEAKRCLVRAGTMLATLERCLTSATQHASKDEISSLSLGGLQSLGSGELRRRKDLLTAAVKERDQLERSLNEYTPRQNNEESEDEREALMSHAARGGSTAKQVGSRRVIGAPAKETERTRELDNTGVLQLQKQIMAEQDQDVEEITKTVQRMKQMGVQINDELQLQNEMLGLLDQDVERVGDKIGVAKKRIGKIK